jgi:hypothetical protein
VVPVVRRRGDAAVAHALPELPQALAGSLFQLAEATNLATPAEQFFEPMQRELFGMPEPLVIFGGLTVIGCVRPRLLLPPSARYVRLGG